MIAQAAMNLAQWLLKTGEVDLKLYEYEDPEKRAYLTEWDGICHCRIIGKGNGTEKTVHMCMRMRTFSINALRFHMISDLEWWLDGRETHIHTH